MPDNFKKAGGGAVMEVKKPWPSLRVSLLRLAVSAFGLLSSLCYPSQAVLAQAADRGAGPQASSVDTLQEVIVTARRIGEVLQKVPLAATAYNGEELKQQ